jgi:hypothetical protein
VGFATSQIVHQIKSLAFFEASLCCHLPLLVLTYVKEGYLISTYYKATLESISHEVSESVIKHF